MFKVYILLQLAFVSVLGNVLFHDCGKQIVSSFAL